MGQGINNDEKKKKKRYALRYNWWGTSKKIKGRGKSNLPSTTIQSNLHQVFKYQSLNSAPRAAQVAVPEVIFCRFSLLSVVEEEEG